MKKMSKYRMLSIVLLVVLLVCTGISGCKKSSQADLSEYWATDSEAAESLRSYVSKVTNKKDTENFIPVEDRIAVFDMDGTLTCETYYTYYDTMMFISYCLEDYPDKVSEDLKEAAAEIKRCSGSQFDPQIAQVFIDAIFAGEVDEIMKKYV